MRELYELVIKLFKSAVVFYQVAVSLIVAMLFCKHDVNVLHTLAMLFSRELWFVGRAVRIHRDAEMLVQHHALVMQSFVRVVEFNQLRVVLHRSIFAINTASTYT